MNRSWGTFTARGGEQVERQIGECVARVAAAVQETLEPDTYRALVLIGGYGRGEGGVDTSGGNEVPHNNLDFLLITSQSCAPEPLKEKLDARLQPISQSMGVSIDLSITSADKLRRASPLVMWCDMRFGHKTILGDVGFVPSLKHLELDRILPSDIRCLMSNRGTLLLINDLVLNRPVVSPDDRKLVIRHTMKAIIGYGDALLFHLGSYHWSYVEKQQRMRRQQDIPASLKSIYEMAMEFRFRPCYSDFADRNLSAWMQELRLELGSVHRRCESMHLGAPFDDWDRYLDLALPRLLFERPGSLKAWGRKARQFLHGASSPDVRSESWVSRLGMRCAGNPGVLSILFPVVAFADNENPSVARVRKILGAATADPEETRRAYLRSWGTHVDAHFPPLLRRMGITLESK